MIVWAIMLLFLPMFLMLQQSAHQQRQYAEEPTPRFTLRFLPCRSSLMRSNGISCRGVSLEPSTGVSTHKCATSHIISNHGMRTCDVIIRGMRRFIRYGHGY